MPWSCTILCSISVHRNCELHEQRWGEYSARKESAFLARERKRGFERANVGKLDVRSQPGNFHRLVVVIRTARCSVRENILL